MGLRDLYNQLEKLVTPIATEVIGTEEFAKVVSTVTAVNKTLRSRTDKLQARAWHALNLPAGSDVQRLRQQVGSLDREVRLLSLELQQARQQARKQAAPRPRKQADPEPGPQAPKEAKPDGTARPEHD